MFPAMFLNKLIRFAWQLPCEVMLQHMLAIPCLYYNCFYELQDVLRFYLFGLVVQLFILLPYMIKASAHHQTWSNIVVRLLDYVVNAVPVGVVTIMVCNGIIGRFRLGKEGLLLMFPECLRLGADLDLICFDKTGTLTHRNVSSPTPNRQCLWSLHVDVVLRSIWCRCLMQ